MTASRIFLLSTLLVGGALTASARPASDTTTPSTSSIDDAAPVQDRHVSRDQLGLETRLLARQLMARIEEHRSRLARLENVTEFFRKQGNLEKLQEMEHLRHRELEAYQQTLGEYRRVLGNHHFDRVARAVRYFIRNQEDEGSDAAAEPFRTRELQHRVENYRDNVAKNEPLRTRGLQRRVENYRDGQGTGKAREASASVDRTLERQLEIERARASERMALAQRLQQARDEQLRLMAEQQRRYNPVGTPARNGNGGGAGRPSAAGTRANPGRPAATPPAPAARNRRPR